MRNNKTLSIVGVGLIGGSLGMAIKKSKAFKSVIGVGRNGKRLARAKLLGAVDEYTTDFKKGVKDADLVVICVPVSKTGDMIKKFSKALKKGAVVTDAGSVKESVVKEAERLLAPKACFVGSHPMAGSEKTGVLNARPGLFKNSTCIVTKTRMTDSRALKQVESMWKKVGARVFVTGPGGHDAMVSEVSHLPHILAFSLALQAGESSRKNKNVSSVAAGAFRDMTRIAASSPEVWADICVDNRKELLKSIISYEKKLKKMKNLIAAGARRRLINEFEKAGKIRHSIMKKSRVK